MTHYNTRDIGRASTTGTRMVKTVFHPGERDYSSIAGSGENNIRFAWAKSRAVKKRSVGDHFDPSGGLTEGTKTRRGLTCSTPVKVIFRQVGDDMVV